METRPRRQFKCLKSPTLWNGQAILYRGGYYVIFDDEPDKLQFLTINGSFGKKYDLSDIPKPIEQWLIEIK